MLDFKPEQEEIFNNLWSARRSNQEEYRFDFRALAKMMRPDLTDAMFDRGIQFFDIGHEDCREAKTYFLMIVNQTF